MNFFNSFVVFVVAAVLALAGLVQGIVALFEFLRQRHNPRIFVLGMVVCLLIAGLAGYGALNSPAPASPKSPAPASPTPSAQPSSSVRATASQTLSPTDTVPTPSPTLTTATKLKTPLPITLECHCSDRVVATITQIVIQPHKMLWSMTFFNNSQQSAYAAFADGNFYLQEGDQINDPAPGKQKYDATGSVIGTFSGIALQAGETQRVTITFSFVLYTGDYTLVSIMQMDCCGQEIAHFDPVLFEFE